MLNKFVLEQLIAFFQKNPVAQGKPTTDDIPNFLGKIQLLI